MASEVRDKLLNIPEIASNSIIYKRLTDPDVTVNNYESALGKYEINRHHHDQFVSLNRCVTEVFQRMDESIVSTVSSDLGKKNSLRSAFHYILTWLSQAESKRWFTLNQDLLVERLINEKRSISLFGISSDNCSETFQCEGFKSQSTAKLGSLLIQPTQLCLDESSDLQYVKIHGSINWLDKDGLPIMVSGANKEEKLLRNQLLNAGMNLLKSDADNGTQILVIGYGFADEHINGILAQALGHGNCELILIGRDVLASRITITDKACKRMKLEPESKDRGVVRARVRHYEGTVAQFFHGTSKTRLSFGDLENELMQSGNTA